jgi:hypothetical protein
VIEPFFQGGLFQRRYIDGGFQFGHFSVVPGELGGRLAGAGLHGIQPCLQTLVFFTQTNEEAGIVRARAIQRQLQ